MGPGVFGCARGPRPLLSLTSLSQQRSSRSAPEANPDGVCGRSAAKNPAHLLTCRRISTPTLIHAQRSSLAQARQTMAVAREHYRLPECPRVPAVARVWLLGVGSCCLHGRGGLGPGDYSPVLDQFAVHSRLDRAGGELDDVDCCLAG